MTLSLERLSREMGLMIIERFPSKKNSVYLVLLIKDQSNAVLKVYDDACRDALCIEKRVLVRAYECGIPVPSVMSTWEDKALLMEYIEGINVCDVVNERQDVSVTRGLGQWLARFHLAFNEKDRTLIKGDTILRNFIAVGEGAESKIYGVDFEEASYGEPISDLGKLCASILDTNPMFTPWKFSCCTGLIEEYSRIYGPVDRRGLEREIAFSLRETASRRYSQKELLLSKARHILDHGLERG